MEISKINEDRSMWKICSSSANKICTWGGLDRLCNTTSDTAVVKYSLARCVCRLCKLHVQYLTEACVMKTS